MSTHVTMNELMALPLPDLKREIKAQAFLVAKLRADIALKKEKDTARLKRERRQLARMQTEQTRKARTALPSSAPASRVPPSAQPSQKPRPARKATAGPSVPSKV